MNYPNNTYDDSKSIRKNEQFCEIISDDLSIPVDKIDYSSCTRRMDLVSKIKFYTQNQDYKKAVELCDSEEGKNKLIIQSRKVKILLKMYRESDDINFLDDALMTCDMYPGNEIFNSHRNRIYNILSVVYINKENFEQSELNSLIRKLIDDKKMSLALGFCDLLNDFNDEELDFMRLEILMLSFSDNNNSGNRFLHKANSICIKYIGNEKFDKFKRQIDLYLNDSVLLTELLGKVYHGITDVTEIQNSDIDIWKKQLLMISYYENNDKKKGQAYIKNIKKDYLDDPSKLKTLNILNERLASNKIKIFDVGLYATYLDCKVDFDVFDSILKSYKESLVEQGVITTKAVEPVRQHTILNEKKMPSKESKKIISCAGVSVNRYNQHNTVDNTTSISSKTKNNQILIKDVFYDEIFEICLYLYVKMNEFDNKKGIKAWDNFENLIYKPVTDKGALNRMNLILNKMAEVGILAKLNDEKIKKYLMK